MLQTNCNILLTAYLGREIMTRLQLLDNLVYRMKVTKKGADADLTDFLYSIMVILAFALGLVVAIAL